MSTCPICKSNCYDGNLLSNGSRYHVVCYNDLVNKQNEQVTKINELNKELASLSDVIAQNSSLTGVLSRLFGN